MKSGYLNRAGRHILRRVLDRLVLYLVVAGAAVGARALTGSSAIAVAVAAGAMAVGLIAARRGTDQPGLPSEGGTLGGPFSWTFTASPSTDLAATVERLQAAKLRLDERGDSYARLSGGSQLRLRLLGGYFIDPVHLPIAATVAVTAPEQKVEVSVRDRLGLIGVRDRKLESRYALRAEQIGEVLRA